MIFRNWKSKGEYKANCAKQEQDINRLNEELMPQKMLKLSSSELLTDSKRRTTNSEPKLRGSKRKI